MKSENKPLSDYDKIQLILNALKAGETRAKLALRLGYTNPKSLDIYMRRKGFVYDSKMSIYTPIPTDKIEESINYTPNKRLSTILSMFSQDNPDARKIAEITGFESHIELAEFMKANQFIWNEKVGNYTRIIVNTEDQAEPLSEPMLDSSEFFIYLPMLRKLFENQDKIYNLLSSTEDSSLSSGKINNTNELTLQEDIQLLIKNLLSNQLTLQEDIQLLLKNLVPRETT